MTPHPATAFKIIEAADWAAARPGGAYAGAPIDLTDGFIHLSARDQVEATASKYFVGQSGLLLLTVDLSALGEAVVWEPSRGGALFPHIYGELPVAAVTAERAFAVTDDGVMVFEDGAAL